MNAMWAGFAAIIAVAMVAGVILSSVDYSSAERFSTASVRLH